MTKLNLPILLLSMVLCCPCCSQADQTAIRRCLREEDLDLDGGTCLLQDLPDFELERICERVGLSDFVRASMTTLPSGERVPREANRETFIREAGQCLQVKEMKSDGLAWSNTLRAQLVDMMVKLNMMDDKTVEAFAAIILARNYKDRSLLMSGDEIHDLLNRGYREGPQVWTQWLERNRHHPETASTIRMLTDFKNIPWMISSDDEWFMLKVMQHYDRNILENIVQRRHDGLVFGLGSTDFKLAGTMLALALGLVALSVKKLFAMGERGGRARRQGAVHLTKRYG